jgi:hypothetical protein
MWKIFYLFKVVQHILKFMKDNIESPCISCAVKNASLNKLRNGKHQLDCSDAVDNNLTVRRVGRETGENLESGFRQLSPPVIQFETQQVLNSLCYELTVSSWISLAVSLRVTLAHTLIHSLSHQSSLSFIPHFTRTHCHSLPLTHSHFIFSSFSRSHWFTLFQPHTSSFTP